MMNIVGLIQVAGPKVGLTFAVLGGPLWLTQNRLLAAGLVLAMVLALAAVGLLSLTRRDRIRQGPTMRRLCRALGLDTPQRRRLEHMAVKTGVRCPAALLISRGCFDIAQKRYDPQGVELRQLNRIRRRVFTD